jgi:hypothetical protein
MLTVSDHRIHSVLIFPRYFMPRPLYLPIDGDFFKKAVAQLFVADGFGPLVHQGMGFIQNALSGFGFP